MELERNEQDLAPTGGISKFSANANLLELQGEFLNKLQRQGRSINTLKNYKTDLHCFNKYLEQENLTGLNINQFDIPHIKQYGAYLEEKYKSDNSRRRRVQALRMFFDFLVEKEIFNNNPVRKLPTSPKFLDIPRPTPFIDVKTLWEYLLKEAHNKNPMLRLLARRNQVIMLLIFGGGLKVSDLSKLREDHIIAGSDSEEPRVLLTPAKRDPYTVSLPKIFSKIYDEYLECLNEMKNSSDIHFDYILFNANPYRILSGGLSARGLETIFEELRKKLMITLTPKSLRQACIFKWLQQGVSDSLIKEYLGVAPSYSLKLYKTHLKQNMYNEDSLEELYKHYRFQN